MELLNLFQQLHFVRPYWLLALIPAALLIWLYSTTQLKSRNWASVIDPRLLPHLLKGTPAATQTIKNKTPSSLLLFAVASSLIISLAGPAFEKRPQPVFKAQSALVIILDLSRSMDAGDIKPSRLSRAHFKVNDILKQRKEGQTALIVYAADAFTVSPLTDDAATIAAQIPALDTNIMPSQGSRLDIALDKAVELFTNAGHAKGDIFILSDSVSQADINKASELNAKGFASSVLAIGTEQGAPINASGGGFIKDSAGSIVVPKLDSATMRKLALAGGGKFTLLSSDDKDINRLLSKIDIEKSGKDKDEQLDASGNKFKTDTWHEEGPWLLLLVIPFAAYAFRRGLVFALLIFILPLPQPAQALEWNELWKNKDQLGQDALQHGDNTKAAELFNNPEWKAAAEYKAGNYEQAIEQLNNINTADAHYNRGNALAKSGQLDEAIKAYNRATDLQTDHEDAKHNKDLIEKAKQKNEQQSSENKDGEQQEQNKQDSDQNDQQPQQGESQDNKENSQQSQDQQDSSKENQQSSAAENDKQDAEKNPQQNKTQEESDANKEQAKKQAAEQQAQDEKENSESSTETTSTDTSEELDLEQQQTQQWLKKIPDDPGGLLRRKFQYQYGREKHPNEKQPW